MDALTENETSAFVGLNDSYIEMAKKMENIAPKCHFSKMFFDQCERESCWECKHCGHTKDINQ